MYLAVSREVQAEVLQEAFEGHRVWVAFQPDLRPIEEDLGLRAKNVQLEAPKAAWDEIASEDETFQSLEQGGKAWLRLALHMFAGHI